MKFIINTEGEKWKHTWLLILYVNGTVYISQIYGVNVGCIGKDYVRKNN